MVQASIPAGTAQMFPLRSRTSRATGTRTTDSGRPSANAENRHGGEVLADADLTIILPAHPGIDHDHIASHARLLLDLRGVTRGTHAENLRL